MGPRSKKHRYIVVAAVLLIVLLVGLKNRRNETPAVVAHAAPQRNPPRPIDHSCPRQQRVLCMIPIAPQTSKVYAAELSTGVGLAKLLLSPQDGHSLGRCDAVRLYTTGGKSGVRTTTLDLGGRDGLDPRAELVNLVMIHGLDSYGNLWEKVCMMLSHAWGTGIKQREASPTTTTPSASSPFDWFVKLDLDRCAGARARPRARALYGDIFTRALAHVLRVPRVLPPSLPQCVRRRELSRACLRRPLQWRRAARARAPCDAPPLSDAAGLWLRRQQRSDAPRHAPHQRSRLHDAA